MQQSAYLDFHHDFHSNLVEMAVPSSSVSGPSGYSTPPSPALSEQPPSTSRKGARCGITSAIMLKATRVCVKLRLVALCMVNVSPFYTE